MLLMINKILLPSLKRDIVYETLEDEWSKKPYVFHSDTLRKDGKAWVHKDIEFDFVIRGEAQVYLDDKTITAKEGDIICVNPYVIHRFLPVDLAKVGILMINTGFLTKNGIDITKLRFDEMIKDSTAAELYREIMSEHERDESFCETAIRAAILRLIVFVCRNYSKSDPSGQELSELRSFGRSFEYTSRAIDYVNANFRRKISLDEVSAAAGASKYHFLRTFKKVTGYTVTDYINKVRCEQARSLLAGGEYSVKEVALRSGFDNMSHFTNTFKKHVGCLPSELLKSGDKKVKEDGSDE